MADERSRINPSAASSTAMPAPLSASNQRPPFATALADCLAPSLYQSDDASMEPLAAAAVADLPAGVATAQFRSGEPGGGDRAAAAAAGGDLNSATLGVGPLLAARLPDVYGGVPPEQHGVDVRQLASVVPAHGT